MLQVSEYLDKHPKNKMHLYFGHIHTTEQNTCLN